MRGIFSLFSKDLSRVKAEGRVQCAACAGSGVSAVLRLRVDNARQNNSKANVISTTSRVGDPLLELECGL
jgi:hypothetical protein